MYKRILVATDGSFYAKQAEDKALALAGRFGSGITAFYVIDRTRYQWAEELMPEIYNKTKKEGEAVLMTFIEKAAQHGIKAEVKLSEGVPCEEIVKEAEARSCDLIILGYRGINAAEEITLGSVVQRVVRRASCDVLVVKG